MPRLAIILSAVGSIESLETTLVSVLENRPADSEIIVALRQPYSDPYDLKGEVQFVPPARGRSTATLNAALALARAPFVHVLAGGCQVEEGWADAALARFGDRRLAAVSPLVWDARHENRLLTAGVGYKHRGQRVRVGEGAQTTSPELLATVLGPSLLAAFYRKSALDFVGGFSTRLSLQQADADLAIVLQQAGFTAAVEPRASVRATPQADAGAAGWGQGLSEERLFWRNLRKAGSTGAVLSHAALVGGELVRGLASPALLAKTAGRLWAALELGSYARHHRLLSELGARSLPARPASGNVRIDRSHAEPFRPEAARPRVQAH